MSEPAQIIVHIVVHGRVQGVGYRAFVEHEAGAALSRGLGAQLPRWHRRSCVQGRGEMRSRT